MSAFDPTFEELPDVLPVFPLEGALLLPRGELPLNIFEPRYLNMTLDSLSGNRMIGMIQPSGADTGKARPPVYRTGCAGRIVAFRESDDGRLMITLKGLCRFEAGEELPLQRGYRRVIPDWSRYKDDMTLSSEPGNVDRDRLLKGLRGYFKTQGITADWKAIEAATDQRLVTHLAMACPFESSEKQALLEAADLVERSRILMALLEMAAHSRNPEDGSSRQ